MSSRSPRRVASLRALVVDERRVVLERRVVAGPDRLLERVDRERAEQVVLAVGAVLVLAARREACPGRRSRRAGYARVLAELDLAAHDLDADAADPARGPGEVLVDEVAVEADGLEHLRAVVAVDGGDAHPADRLDHALRRRLAVALLGLVDGPLDGALADLVVDGLEREVRVDRRGAVADQQAEVVGLARLARLEHEPHPAAGPVADQVVVDGGHREQRRDRRVDLVVAAVGQDDLVVALGDGLGRLAAEVLDRPAEPRAVVGDLEQDRQRDRPEAAAGRPAVERPDRLQLGVGQDRGGERHLVGGVRARARGGSPPGRSSGPWP